MDRTWARKRTLQKSKRRKDRALTPKKELFCGLVWGLGREGGKIPLGFNEKTMNRLMGKRVSLRGRVSKIIEALMKENLKNGLGVKERRHPEKKAEVGLVGKGPETGSLG